MMKIYKLIKLIMITFKYLKMKFFKKNQIYLRIMNHIFLSIKIKSNNIIQMKNH